MEKPATVSIIPASVTGWGSSLVIINPLQILD